MIAYRQEKADIALDDADFLAESGRYSLAANRLYYALYYAASALLLSKGIVTKRHAGLINQIHSAEEGCEHPPRQQWTDTQDRDEVVTVCL